MGSTISCGGGYSHPPVPHVQTYAVATDRAGLDVLLAKVSCRSSVLLCASGWQSSCPWLQRGWLPACLTGPRLALAQIRRICEHAVLQGTVFHCWTNIAETVIHSELGSSVAIREAGYNLDSADAAIPGRACFAARAAPRWLACSQADRPSERSCAAAEPPPAPCPLSTHPG